MEQTFAKYISHCWQITVPFLHSIEIGRDFIPVVDMNMLLYNML